MTHSQIPLAVWRNNRGGAARARLREDPQLRRMLATHVHCGEPMQLVGGHPVPADGFVVRNDGGPLTYRCACGFSFDHRED